MNIIGIDHIGIAVKSIDDSFEPYGRAFGVRLEGIEHIADRFLKIGFFNMGNVRIELIEPTSPESAIAKFIAGRGEGIHHFCLRVDNIEIALKHLADQGYQLIDKIPRQGAGNSRIAFVHPKSFGGVLIELKEVFE